MNGVPQEAAGHGDDLLQITSVGWWTAWFVCCWPEIDVRIYYRLFWFHLPGNTFGHKDWPRGHPNYGFGNHCSAALYPRWYLTENTLNMCIA